MHEKRGRDAYVMVMLTDGEKRELRRLAAAAKMTMGKYIRSEIFGRGINDRERISSK